MKFWIEKEGGGHNLIVITDSVIYSSSYSVHKLREFEYELKKGNIPEVLTGTPFSYIKTIVSNSRQNKIKIYYGKESDIELDVKNEKFRAEIMEYLKEDKKNLPVYQKEDMSSLKAGLKPLLFLLIAVVLTSYTALIAAEMENGAAYTVRGRVGGEILGNLVIGLAELLGFNGVLIAGTIIFMLLLYKLVKCMQNPPVIERLDYRKKKPKPPIPDFLKNANK